MNKILILTMGVLAFSATNAFAQNQQGEDQRGPRGQMERPDGPGGPDGPGPDEMRKHGPKLDLDGDGVVSKAEFLKHAEERFSKIDKDGSGDISKEEGRAAHKHMKDKRKKFMEKRQDRRQTQDNKTTSE